MGHIKPEASFDHFQHPLRGLSIHPSPFQRRRLILCGHIPSLAVASNGFCIAETFSSLLQAAKASCRMLLVVWSSYKHSDDCFDVGTAYRAHSCWVLDML